MTAGECVGENVVTPEGDKIGKIADLYVDQQTRQPEWFIDPRLERFVESEHRTVNVPIRRERDVGADLRKEQIRSEGDVEQTRRNE